MLRTGCLFGGLQTRRRLLANDKKPYNRMKDLEYMLRKDLLYGKDFVRAHDTLHLRLPSAVFTES